MALTEAGKSCRANKIMFTYMVDGSCFARMGRVDLYCMIGNALDNAIEYLTSLEDPSKRVLTVAIQPEGDMDKLLVENYLGKR